MFTETGMQESKEAADVFLERTCDIINAGAQSIMISIGHRSGLFDVMAKLEPTTSQEIADSAELNERYVREWLAVMVTAEIVNYNSQVKTYHFPEAHAACLTRGAELGNVAIYAQFISLMGVAQEHCLHFLESGSGATYADYPCFHHIMAEDSEQSVLSTLFDITLPLIQGMDSQLQSGINVLDVGCGKGLILIAMAKRYPQSRFVGYDLCEETIAEATRIANANNLQNIRFKLKDLTDFDEQEHYDLITSFDAVHDQKSPQALITKINNALKSTGVYLMQDIGGSAQLENNIDFPMASMLYAMSFSHCTPISLGQGGEGLGAMWGWETALKMLKNAGFSDVERHILPHDPMNVWFVSFKEVNHALV